MANFMCQLRYRLQSPVIQTNTNLGVAVKALGDVIEVHNQLTLSTGDYHR